MDKKICVKCSAENEEHFTYCKYCGAPLPVVDRQAPLGYADDQTPPQEEQIISEGITGKEYSIYVDKNADDIVPVFEKIQLSGKKASWCTPVFILGLFFGFYGIAAWFFSRKMIKSGFIITAVGILFTAVDALLNIDLNRALYSGFMYGGTEALYSAIYYYDTLSVSTLPELIFSFIAAIFALNVYKNKATRDISALKAFFTEDEQLHMYINAAGGRNILLAFIPVVIGIIAGVLSFAVTVV